MPVSCYGKAWEKKTVQDKINAVLKELENDIARWHEIKANGCCDPGWPDGVNMNLKRNHIIYDLKLLSELDTKPKQLSFFQDALGGGNDPADVMVDPRVPPKVPDDYMAKDRPCFYFSGKDVSHST